MSNKNLDSFLKASAEYLTIFPYDDQLALSKKFLDTEPLKRQGVWDSFNLPVTEIEEKFIEMTKERNKLAQKKGYSSYIDMHLEKYSIPQLDYKEMLENTDELIQYCNEQLPSIDDLPEWFYSKYNFPCFICRMTAFPFESNEEVMNYFSDKFTELNELSKKINIELGEYSSMHYEKELDSFKITLDKNINRRHRLLDLVHELAHMIVYIRSFRSRENPLGKGLYSREKEALKIELGAIKDLSGKLYRSLFGEFLLVYWRVLFETELYKEPNQDLSRLYAKTFNRCFVKGKQKDNPFYLLDSRITLNPFSTLPHAIAQSKIILKLPS